MAGHVEMLSGRRKKDYAAESAGEALAAQASAMGFAPLAAEDEEEPGEIEATAAEASGEPFDEAAELEAVVA